MQALRLASCTPPGSSLLESRSKGANWRQPPVRRVSITVQNNSKLVSFPVASRDDLRGSWEGQFRVSHSIMRGQRLLENVKHHNMEHRALRDGEKEENVMLEFAPQRAHVMLVACCGRSGLRPGEPELPSFAAIIDDSPPPEVVSAGTTVVSLRSSPRTCTPDSTRQRPPSKAGPNAGGPRPALLRAPPGRQTR